MVMELVKSQAGMALQTAPLDAGGHAFTAKHPAYEKRV